MSGLPESMSPDEARHDGLIEQADATVSREMGEFGTSAQFLKVTWLNSAASYRLKMSKNLISRKGF
jgi:hypothetical protein